MSKISRHLEVIYCDDIRNEAGNKVSYMGVYTRELNVPSAPLVLAKLCIAIKVLTDVDDPFEFLEVRVFKTKGDEEIELVSSGPQPKPSPENMMVERDDETYAMSAQMFFILAPFQIDEETILRVRATTEREDLRGPALRIRIVPPPSAAMSIH